MSKSPEQQHVDQWAKDKPHAKRVWNDMAALYKANPQNWHKTGEAFPDLDHLYETALTAHRDLRADGERLAHERVSARQREEAQKRDREQAERAEAMRGESVRASIERSISEAGGSEYRTPEAPKGENAGDTIRRTIAQLGERNGD